MLLSCVQVLSNYQRKSVKGLSFDYQLLNILGYTCYSVFTASLLWNTTIRNQYDDAFSTNLVSPQDCFFALHGALLTSITIFQCFIYDSGGQKLSWFSIVFVIVSVSLSALYAVLISSNKDGGPTIFSGVPLFSWLCFIYWLSLIKLGVTCSKYFPQAILNCQTRSTEGWSIGNVLLDFTGGVLSIAQLLLDGSTLGWGGVIGDPIKFSLGFISMIFDVFFMIQHYCLFKKRDRYTLKSFVEAGESIDLVLDRSEGGMRNDLIENSHNSSNDWQEHLIRKQSQKA